MRLTQKNKLELCTKIGLAEGKLEAINHVSCPTCADLLREVKRLVHEVAEALVQG